jgi:hypothetical protein
MLGRRVRQQYPKVFTDPHEKLLGNDPILLADHYFACTPCFAIHSASSPGLGRIAPYSITWFAGTSTAWGEAAQQLGLPVHTPLHGLQELLPLWQGVDHPQDQ